MTSTQSMHRRGTTAGTKARRHGGTEAGNYRRMFSMPRAVCQGSALVLIVVLFITLSGCNGPRLEQPTVVTAPYERNQLWAVAPFANESGVSVVDPYRTADLFVQEAQAVHGIDVIPVNRVIRAMREVELNAITTAGEARLLMNVLGVDGLVVGTITSYDPYPPLSLGMAVELHVQERRDAMDRIDHRELLRSPTANPLPERMRTKNPVAQSAGVFDAANHRTLAQLREYSRGRNVPDSAYGKDIYRVSMDRYAQFVSHRLILGLLVSERQRVSEAREEIASR